MKIKWLCTLWGMNQPTLDDNLRVIKDAGFEGVEMKVPYDCAGRNSLGVLLNENGLDLVAQVRAEGATVDAQIESLKKGLGEVAELNPLFVNAHCGKDFWHFKENRRVIASAQSFAAERGIKVLHETHRGRATFCTTATMDIIEAVPEMRFTADFSHWCCVHNSLLQDQSEAVSRVIERADYIHARVGCATSPQITDPRAPEWKDAVESHMRWWEKIAEHQKKNHAEYLPICSEFGPPPYMATLPFTGEPIADAWEINCYMKDMLKERLGHFLES